MATPMATPVVTLAPRQPSLLQLFRGLLRVPWWIQKPRVEELGPAEGCSSPGKPPNWEHWEDGQGKSHLATWAPCCPSPLQLLRGLWGLLGSLWGTQQPREEELGAAEGCSHPGQRWDGASRESMESLLGKLEELSIRGCLVLSTSDQELLGDSHRAQQAAGSQEGTAPPGYSRGKALRMNGLPAAPGADGEGVASPEPMLSVDSDAEWEKQQLLEGEGARPPKAEMSPGKRFWNASRQQRAPNEAPALGSVMGREEESLLSGAAAGPANPWDVLLARR
ncbi:uncharacterized protein LOC111939825 isoform X2 [Cyanistes caeruleus]|uniref:uncharacterized protein LOC111939825 isoform X2 n=1 Tax=Cyanistes caeruleus TaxID=156563 RepID=UPI000CDA68BD|nr:uncharacterized protein LOC111939825 isoform X2 [Cyanistes caeruleus]